MKIGSKYLLVPKRWDLLSPAPPPLLYMTLGVQYEHRHHRTSAFPNRYPRSCLHEELRTARCISHPTVRHPGPNYSRIDVSALTHFPLYDATLRILVRYFWKNFIAYMLVRQAQLFFCMNDCEFAHLGTTAASLRSRCIAKSRVGNSSSYTILSRHFVDSLHIAHLPCNQWEPATQSTSTRNSVYSADTGERSVQFARESRAYQELTRRPRLMKR